MKTFNPESTKIARMLRRLADVFRWAVIPVTRRQSVAEHSFHTLCIARLVAEDHALLYTGNYRLELLEYILEHDMDESLTSDKPSPYKRWLRKNNMSPSLSPIHSHILDMMDVDAERAILQVVKIADFLEALVFINEEYAMGNGRVSAVYDDIYHNFCVAWEGFDWNGPMAPRDIPFDDKALNANYKPSAEEYLAAYLNLFNPALHPGLDYLK